MRPVFIKMDGFLEQPRKGDGGGGHFQDFIANLVLNIDHKFMKNKFNIFSRKKGRGGGGRSKVVRSFSEKFLQFV